MSLKLGTTTIAGVSKETTYISNAHQLLDFKWSDHLLNDMSWLRADTFSWQSGETYEEVYNHLIQDIQNITTETETIGSYTVTFYRATDGHKICLADQEQTVLNIYNTYGIAWYYILDTTNTQFKLPRTKYGFEGLRTNVGDKIDESLPNATINVFSETVMYGSGSAYIGQSGVTKWKATQGTNTSFNDGACFSLNKASSTYQDNAPVQERATQMYLYFYVGDYNQTAIEETAGLNSELFNGKADVDLSNISASQSVKNEIVSWGMPDYANGISLAQSTNSEQQFTIPSDGVIAFRFYQYQASTFNGYVYINNELICGGYSSGSNSGQTLSATALVNKNDIVRYKTNDSSILGYINLTFYPMKGVN